MAYSDDIAGAPEITIGGTDGGWDNLSATDNTGEPVNPIGSSGNNVWQKVHLVTRGVYQISHQTGDGNDTVMAIFTGPPSAGYTDLVNVGYGDDEAGDSKPLITYFSPGGEWLYIESSGYGGSRYSGENTLIGFTAVDPRWNQAHGWFGDSWTADMGAYTGVWPQPFPAAFGTLDISDEIDFIVGLANPATPTDVTTTFDGSYPAQIFDAYTTRLGPSPTNGTFVDAVGGASVPSWGDPEPAGAHLYLTVYTVNRLPPPDSPEVYLGAPTPPPPDVSGWQDNGDGSWSALMGLYVGHWPMQPPPRLGADDEDVSFTVAFPNPVGGRAVALANGTYPTPDFDTTLFAGTPPFWQFNEAGIDGYPDVAYGDPQPPGLVLRVSIGSTVSGHPPANPPAWYVPAGYTAAGACPTERAEGHWVDWQPGIARDVQSTEPTSGFRMITGSGSRSADFFTDITPLEVGALSDALGSLLYDPSFSNALVLETSFGKAAVGIGSPDRTQASVYVGQSFRTYHANPFDTVPPVPGVEWIDNSPPPQGGAIFQYEVPEQVNGFAWTPRNWNAVSNDHSMGTYTGVHVQQHAALPSSGSSFVAGTEVGSVTTVNNFVGTLFLVSPAVTGSYDIYLSFYADPMLGSVGTSMPPDQPPPFQGFYSAQVNTVAFHYTWTTSPWRYWIPGALVPSSGHPVAYLRMTQRDDGLGIHRHPRLPITSMPTSVQLSRAPRIGHNNRYS